MTLVYRSEKISSLTNTLNNIGPGSYNIQQIKNLSNNKKKNNSSSIFLSATKRDAFQIQKYQKQIRQKQKAELKHKQKLKKYQNQSQMKLQTNTFSKNSYLDQQQQCQQYIQQQKNNHNINDIIKPKQSNDCKHIFNSKVQRFNLQKLQKMNLNKQRQQKCKQKYLAEQFSKLLVKNVPTHQKISKSLNFKQLNQKKKPILDIVQKFPSIPTWQHSYGYRKDPQTNLLVANENPNKIFKIQSQLQNNQVQINKSLGPGYYIYKDKQDKKNVQQIKKSLRISQSKKQKQLINSICYPKTNHSPPIYNSIQDKQNKLKLRIKILGKNHINKIQDYQNQNIQISNKNSRIIIQGKQSQSIDKKTILLNHRMLQQFKQYLPAQVQKQPLKYFQKLSSIKNSIIDNQSVNLNLNRYSQHNQSSLNFLSKSTRFQSLNSTIINQKDKKNSQILQDNSNVQNSSFLLKSFNKKQSYTLGQQRFKQRNNHQKIGPGAYNHQLPEYIPNSSSLKSKQERFFHINSKSQIPGPGQYDVIQQKQKNPNYLSQIYAQYKKNNNQQIKKIIPRQSSMQTLYQTWGKQVNFKQKQLRLKQNLQINKQKKSNHSNQQNKQNKQTKQNNYRSFNNVKISLNSEVNKFDINKQIRNLTNLKKIQERTQKINSVHPKIIKHLYEYNQQDKNLPQIGPGCYQIRKQMIRKTHNVTYT